MNTLTLRTRRKIPQIGLGVYKAQPGPDTKNAVLGVRMVYQGSLNTSVVRPGELFREAVKEGCAALIVVHNHPSGDPTPSPEDVAVTRDIVKAGEIMGIDVLDHVVIGEGRYVSMKERGLGFG